MASILGLHIYTECKRIICSQLEHKLGHIGVNEFASRLEELAWDTHCKLTIMKFLSKELSRNLSSYIRDHTILASYSSTCGKGDAVRAQVLECETRSIAHVLKQFVRELIPCGTWVVDILHARLYLCMVDAIYWFFNDCVDKFSTHHDSVFCQHAYIDIVNWLSSHEAIVDYFINACTWIYRNHHWYGQFSWAVDRNNCCQPHDGVGWVGEGELNMFARTFHFGNIYIVPLCLTRGQCCAFVPIERNQILAQAWTGSRIYHIKTKTKFLGRGHMQIHLCSIYFIINFLDTCQLLYKTTYHIGSH